MRILVVDDDKVLSSIIKIQLEKKSYTVDIANSGKEALFKFKKAFNSKTPYKIAILDYFLPDNFNGQMLSAFFNDKDPEIKCILFTAHDDDPMLAFSSAYKIEKVIKKPSTVEKLAECVGSLLTDKEYGC